MRSVIILFFQRTHIYQNKNALLAPRTLRSINGGEIFKNAYQHQDLAMF